MSLRQRGYLLESVGIEGKSKAAAKKYIYKLVGRSLDGFFRDEFWTPINRFWKTLHNNKITFAIDSAKYRKDKRGVPDAKIWKFQIPFEDNRGKKATIYGSITAAGAGSVKDPLDKYDVTLVLS